MNFAKDATCRRCQAPLGMMPPGEMAWGQPPPATAGWQPQGPPSPPYGPDPNAAPHQWHPQANPQQQQWTPPLPSQPVPYGLPSQVPVASPAGSPYTRVGGWLLFFAVLLTIVHPLLRLIGIMTTIGLIVQIGARAPGLTTVLWIECLVTFVFMFYSVVAGYKVWAIRPGAIRFAKTYLSLWLLATLADVGLVFAVELPDAVKTEIIKALPGSILGPVVFAGLWSGYLNTSDRVKRTFPPE